MAPFEDPWEILGLDESAEQQEVESAFRRKALSCHPDRHPDDSTARERFDRLSRAKETLLDPARREAALHRKKFGVEPGEELQRQGPAPGKWVEGRGFHAKAPDERKRAENERIIRADEEAFQRYRAQKRAEAEAHLRDRTGGRVGTAEGGSMGLQEAREAFARRLERQSDPKLKRRQRAEEERRQREVERQRREEGEQRRLQAWNERQRAQATKTRDLNDAKQRHWQSWDDSAGIGNSMSAEGVDTVVSSHPVVGTWLYGNKPSEYRIIEGSGGRLHFDGPSRAGAGRLRGLLSAAGEWLEADIAHASGEPFGSMRFLFVSGDDGEEGLISQCWRLGSGEWGREVFARRALPCSNGAAPRRGEPPAREVQVQAPSAAPAEPSADGSNHRPGAASQARSAVAGGGELRIAVVVDEALGFHSEVVMARGSTVLQLKERIAADDPTGGTKAEDFGLASPTTGERLRDDVELAEEHGTLRVCQGREASSAEPGLLAWLKSHRLEAYYEAMLEQGFEQMEDLQEAPVEKRDELASLAGMKLGHSVRFRKALKMLDDAQS